MCRFMHVTAVFCLLAAGSAFGQPYRPTDQDRNWVIERVTYMKGLYGLNEAQAQWLNNTALERLGDQAAFQMDPAMNRTIRSLRAAVDSAEQMGADDPNRTALVDRMTGQLFGVYAKSPLAYSRLAEALEPTLPKPQVEGAYVRMKETFAERLRRGGVDLKAGTIDLLSGQRVELPSLAVKKAALPAPAPREPAKAQPDRVNPAPVATDTPNLQSRDPKALTAANNPATAGQVQPQPAMQLPPPPPEVFPPAPPMAQWASDLDKLTAKYTFTPEQLTKARTIFEQCTKRADKHKSEKADAISEAQKLPDEKVRTERLAEVNKPLDRVYAELTRRVTALATMEQRAKVEPIPVAPPPMAVRPVTTPTTNPAADPHAGHNH